MGKLRIIPFGVGGEDRVAGFTRRCTLWKLPIRRGAGVSRGVPWEDFRN